MGMRIRVLGGIVALLGLMTTACGELSIRTWVKVIEDQSNGEISFGPGTTPTPITRTQGGFLGTVKVNTENLFAPMNGTIAVEDVRIAGHAGMAIGEMCVWGNPAAVSGGTVRLDLFGGASSATLNLSAKATTRLSTQVFQPPVVLEQAATFPLGQGLSLTTLTNALNTGATDGLFATNASFVGESTLGGIPITFALNLFVSNDGAPPLFDTDLLSFCARFFNEQGKDMFFGLNSKSSYLRAASNDSPQMPRVIPLADLGAVPGNTLRLKPVGGYSDTTELRDGSLVRLAGVFSSSSTVLGASNQNRVPGAINAGPDINTPGYWQCLIWPLCWQVATNISQDFRIDPTLDITVPSGATHLVVAPVPSSMKWADNSGFNFGVSVEVNPAP